MQFNINNSLTMSSNHDAELKYIFQKKKKYIFHMELVV